VETARKRIGSRWRKRDRPTTVWGSVSHDVDDRIRRFLNYRAAVSDKASPDAGAQDPLNQLITEEQHGFECCPTKKEIVEPRGGITREGKYVHLVTAAHSRQRFHEERCDFDRLSTPVPYCRNVTSSPRHVSSSVSQLVYVY
jgi:hypothetical protein